MWLALRFNKEKFELIVAAYRKTRAEAAKVVRHYYFYDQIFFMEIVTDNSVHLDRFITYMERQGLQKDVSIKLFNKLMEIVK